MGSCSSDDHVLMGGKKKKKNMAIEALSTNELLNFIIYDTISAAPQFSSFNINNEDVIIDYSDSHSFLPHIQQQQQQWEEGPPEPNERVTVRKKKRRRRTKVCKNKEEAETQRMTHITVERNRRKQMNEHLSVLRSLMPDSYVQRGDQASIVGGAIEYVKELEHLLQTLEAQKLLLLQQGGGPPNEAGTVAAATATSNDAPSPFGQFFAYPQYTWSQNLHNYTSKTKAAIADIEVTLIETHANIRILSRRAFRHLSRIVAGLQALHLTILHLNVTTLDPLALYSISAKVEEGCQLISADDIAGAVHHMLRIIEEEATLFDQP